ncbi:MAG: peptidase M22, partial [Acutalibacteraceae bacterium]
AAIYDDYSGKMISKKRLLPVEDNAVGLMQSKALFYHTKQLPEVINAAFDDYYKCGGKREDIQAVCVSSRPRNVDGSYMPVFLAGVAAANAIASALHIPCYETAHQVGHVLAALYSANRLDLAAKRFLAFHVSGGTTEALLVAPDENEIIKCKIAAQSLDLKAGQAIDRIGVMMGLHFPAGAELDKLSQSGELTAKPHPTLKGTDCCLSGLENICKKMYDGGESAENVARFAIEYIYETIAAMSERLTDKYGALPFVYAGGVMSNSIISKRLSNMGGIFAAPEFSSDNAAGVAIAAKMFYHKYKEC